MKVQDTKKYKRDKGEGYILTEFIRHDPSYFLAHDFSLKVYPFNWQETFFETFWTDDVVLKFGAETFAVPDCGRVNLVDWRKIREEEEHW